MTTMSTSTKPSPLLLTAALLLAVGAVLGLTVPMSTAIEPEWNREAYRVVFFHMPLAFAGTVMFIVAAVHAVRYLASRDLKFDTAAAGSAELGLVLLGLATATGMIFAKTQWGAWWNWDPRQTSVFFVMLMYAAYLALRAALPEDESKRARLSSAYLLLAVAPMVWLVGIFPRTHKVAVASMHPVKPPLDGVHWRIIMLNFAGWLLLAAVLRGLQDRAGAAARRARETY
jgi:heme exporter protein C